jgi:endonuclease/exonuclease/phosphatase family metal-dependent hydrolase
MKLGKTFRSFNLSQNIGQVISFGRIPLIGAMFFLPSSSNLHAQTAKVARNAHIRSAPDGASVSLIKLEKGVDLKVLLTTDTLGYYAVAAQSGECGYIYRTLVKISSEDPAWWGSPTTSLEPKDLHVCSFNIKWLGSSKSKENRKLVDLMLTYDLVIVQELVAPPFDGVYPNGEKYDGDAESAVFFDLMYDNGFRFFLSNEDTGKNKNHSGSSQSEWFVVFYRDGVLRVDSSRCEFISSPLVLNSTFDRVPYRVQFSTIDNTLDFSVINVHLASDEGAVAERKKELETIVSYANSQWNNEKDFLIVGDMNIQSSAEFTTVLPIQWQSLNDECRATNVASAKNPDNQKPYDHVMYFPEYTAADLDLIYDLEVVDLFTTFYTQWAIENPSSASSSSWVNSFGSVLSDHHPVTFKMVYGVADDD